MKFDKFTLIPAEGRLVSAEEQKTVGEIIESSNVLEQLPNGSEVLVEIGRIVSQGTSMVVAHAEWLESYFPNVETPTLFPRQPLDAKTPVDVVHVTVNVINNRTGGMGSHFGFEGYFLSLLISLREKIIWDARGERAK